MNTALWPVARTLGAKRAARFLPPRHRVVTVTPDKKRPLDQLLIEGALCPPAHPNGRPASVAIVMEERTIGALNATVLLWFAHDPQTQWMCIHND